MVDPKAAVDADADSNSSEDSHYEHRGRYLHQRHPAPKNVFIVIAFRVIVITNEFMIQRMTVIMIIHYTSSVVDDAPSMVYDAWPMVHHHHHHERFMVKIIADDHCQWATTLESIVAILMVKINIMACQEQSQYFKVRATFTNATKAPPTSVHPRTHN